MFIIINYFGFRIFVVLFLGFWSLFNGVEFVSLMFVLVLCCINMGLFFYFIVIVDLGLMLLMFIFNDVRVRMLWLVDMDRISFSVKICRVEV